ncbi:hypothetical protein BJ875DRAFT_511588 [Amylocarpus encephaloides]|uniref:Uncharacterized protein n=1 Tax=Amylocarpus encephaloides TaxID=45428 RepID=A0A9P7YHM5_9HELO|nr:hypothetical protein BJ875DRAFT_511588 [Amylocarpus encephaloides]
MCHLCRKAEKFQTLDSNIPKPICILLAKLHKQAEPHLGDFWLWRHNITTEIQTFLAAANSKISNSVLKSMAEDVEKELDHIKYNLPLHPPRRSMGRWEALKTYIEPRESVSNNVSKSSQDELRRSGRTVRRRKRAIGEGNGGGKSKLAPGLEVKIEEGTKGNVMDTDPRTYERLLSGSDLDPSPFLMEQSSRKVAEWLIKCNEAASTENYHDNDTDSLISFVDGGLAQRPDLDVKIWSRVRSLSRKFTGSRNRRSCSNSGQTHSKSSRITTYLSDCVYDDPPHKLKLDERLIQKFDRIASDKERLQFIKNLSSRLYLKMGQSLSRKKNVPVDKAIRMIKVDNKRGKGGVYMTGGRSEGRETRDMPASTEALFGGQDDIGRSSFGDVTRGRFALTQIEYEECVEGAAGGLANTSSLLSAKTKSSSRDSVVDMGSVIRRLKRVQKPVRAIPRDATHPRRPRDSSSEDSFTPTTPEPIKRSSQPSPKTTNLSQAHKEQIRSKVPIRAKPRDTAQPRRLGDSSSEDSFTPTAPEPEPIKRLSRQSTKRSDVNQDQAKFGATARPRRPGDISSESSFVPTAPEPVPIRSSPQHSPKMGILHRAREEQLRRDGEYAAEKIAEERNNPSVLRWQGKDYYEIQSSKPRTVSTASPEGVDRREHKGESNRQAEQDNIDAVRKRRVQRAVESTQANKYKCEERQKYWHKK